MKYRVPSPKYIKRFLVAVMLLASALLGLLLSDLEEPSRKALHPDSQETVSPQRQYFRVTRVVDGDTIRVKGLGPVRYIGIDTPEFGEPFFEEAKRRNFELVGGKDVRVVICKGEPRDRYGRTLAWVYVDGTFVNGEILSEGLAKTLIIPPCGLERVGLLKEIEREAKKRRLGIWGLKDEAKTAPPSR